MMCRLGVLAIKSCRVITTKGKTNMQKEKYIQRRLAQKPRQNDARNDFMRDESRLIHSAAFRRLQAKTQVLGLGESDFYRTRLTHSMEVAQIGRGIVLYLKDQYKNDKNIQEHLPDMELISSICLAHDIGHPPFGHGGEVALNYCMRDHGGFEGNAQTLRILGKLEKYTENYGLNPTRRMLLGVLKYPVAYETLVNKNRYEEKENKNRPYWCFKAENEKPPKCYYDEDQDILDFIFDGFDNKNDKINFVKHQEDPKGNKEPKKEFHRVTMFKSLDCSIMDLADNISYSLHDLEDALSLGMISRKDWTDHFNKSDKALFENAATSNDVEELKFDKVVDGLFGSSHERKNTIGALVNLMITNVKIVDNKSGCESVLLSKKVQLDNPIEKIRDKIFNLVLDIVIKDKNVQQLEFKGQKLIIDLFYVLESDPERFLPQQTLDKWNDAKGGTKKMRVLCDFISGMTDDYATKFYEKLFSPRKGSIFDKI